MSHNIMNLRYILEKSRWMNSEFHDNSTAEPESELNILRHQLLDLAYYNHLITSSEIDEDL